ncbi:MAG: HAD-IC family P-type ATPase, partial [Myxococcota bacterium]
LLESGARVAADIRLLDTHGLRIDESLLTGESLPVEKDATPTLTPDAPLAERRNMAFAGSMVASGRAAGLVVATGLRTEVGAIAGEIAAITHDPTPLIQRTERFARVIGAAVLVVAALVVVLGTLRGDSLGELLLAGVALAVSAIPEGLPIALTVALAVAVSRMAKRGVVVRQLPAVEGLGSCGVIATDKTGTLTRNELTVERVVAGPIDCAVTGTGYAPRGELVLGDKPLLLGEHPRLFRLLRAACLANEANLVRRLDGEEEAEAGWEWSGDPTDVALLAVAIKAGCDVLAFREVHELVGTIPFEPERRYAASFHGAERGGLVCVKGAPERVLEMCVSELDEAEDALRPLDRARAFAAVETLMRAGYRVLAIADAETPVAVSPERPAPEPDALVFLGLVAMTDPPREGVPEALAQCRRSGVRVVMVTGDHATTANSIAERIGLAAGPGGVLLGKEIVALDDDALAERVGDVSVVARATPTDKLRVVDAWQRRGALIAVTGDGVNDAPALRRANLGVAMGRGGTDVAREAADLVITDDNFASIVGGIEEGRVAYDNVRKAVYLLVSTGFGEVLLVAGAIALGLPLPLTAVQLLWLNLVTNGIQDVALVFEPGEPRILERQPRPPQEGIFDRLMVRRTLLAGLVFAGIGMTWWWLWMDQGMPLDDARNRMVQLFVLFEIFHIGNSRSERISLFRLNPLRNRMLLIGTLGALGIHLAALQAPFFQTLLGVAPLTLQTWGELAASAAVILVVMELHKLWIGWRARAP